MDAWYVDGIVTSSEELKLVNEYEGFDITDDDIVLIYRLGVEHGKEIAVRSSTD